ncbi:MAG: FAD-binding oxidoreductase, partial [bacterium]|nr:FAD-binding oxidoreductase [bacterium]
TLEAEIAGEVRFDKIYRALYSTDASVYQMEPLGVVVAASRDDILRTVQICHRHQCPVTLRGGGTSQAGQAVGHGLQLDTSKHLNRLLEVNAEERWARVEPGIVLDELNELLKPHSLQFGVDISSSSRATLGGMIANNSSGARSILYGLTSDNVDALDVVLSDGSEARLGPLTAEELEARCAADTLEADACRTLRRVVAECGDEIASSYPTVLRRVMGYYLEPFADP